MIEIRETRNIQDVLQCVPYECQIRDKGRDKVPLKEMLYSTAQWFASDPDFHFFMFYLLINHFSIGIHGTYDNHKTT